MRQKYGYQLTEAQKRWIERQQESGTVGCDKDRLWLTPEGLRIADLLTVDLLSKGPG
jgi:hypothetical protein